MTMDKSLNINANYLHALSRIFTPLVLDSVAEKGHSLYLTEVCSNSLLLNKIDMDIPFSDFLNKVYGFLFKNYRNEYIYKNVIANNILLGKHSLNTSQMLTEFRVGKCKADAVVINGTSTVYEIKSELDSFNRLEKQLGAYMQVFDHINVITSKQQAEKLLKDIPEIVGILIVTDKKSISTLRVSISNKKNIVPEVLFDSMRKNEYLNVIEKLYGAIPDVPNTNIFKECKRLYIQKNPEIAHDITMAELKKRNEASSLADFLKNAPDSLSAYIISNANNKFKLQALADRFTTNIGTILVPV
jgi:hypothetical protein